MPYAANTKLTRTADATSEPLSLATAKQFCRIDTGVTVDDGLISSLITAARLECENICSRSFVNTTWNMTVDYFPPGGPGSPGRAALLAPLLGGGGWSNGRRGASDYCLQLPMPPLVSVTAINYLDGGGVSRLLNPSTYRVSTGTPGQIIPQLGSIFPLTYPGLSAVSVDYVAGYGPDATYVPKAVQTAMGFLVAHYYYNRTGDVAIPRVVANLLQTEWRGQYA